MSNILCEEVRRPEFSAEIERWYVVRTSARHEKRVEEHFRIRQIKSFLPLCHARRHWRDGTNRTLQLPLFPSYLFVHIGRDHRVSVLAVPGVLEIVGGGRGTSVVPDTCVDSLRRGVEAGIMESHPLLTKGTLVRIRSGIMAGHEGVLIRHKNGLRVAITLDMMMNSATVEVEAHEIEPTGRTPPARSSSGRSS